MFCFTESKRNIRNNNQHNRPHSSAKHYMSISSPRIRRGYYMSGQEPSACI